MPSPHRVDHRPGLVAALLVLCLYGGWAVSVDFPRAAYGFHSDEATYYMMGHSLARDLDLTYRRDDLVRVWAEFPSGPSGVFLKTGRDVEGIAVAGAIPFFEIRSRPDSDTERLYFGKSYAYPLAAAPFVAALGTNGFLLLHAVLFAAIVLVGYLFLNTRMSPTISLLLATGFLMASVAPAYFVWITPEVFNLAVVMLGYFCWLYKEVAPAGKGPPFTRWLRSPASDLVAVVLLGIATFSKPSNVLLVGPVLVWLAWHRRWRPAIACGLLFGCVVAGAFAVNVAITGDWNYQGGERRTFYGAYPFQTADAGFDVGLDRATDRVLTEVIFDPDVFWTVFGHNLGYFFVGRYSGLLPYFFPSVFALMALIVAWRRVYGWQLLILAVALAEILLLVVVIPYNYFGGGGVLGNRYFMSTYGLFLFMVPPIHSLTVAFVPWVLGSLFAAQVALNPFFSSFYPAEHAKRGLLRLLPVERSLVNDLPINTNVSRVRVLFGERRRFQVYFLDDNAYGREENSFWVRGESKAEFLVKTAEPASRLVLTLAAGDEPNRVTTRVGGEVRTLEMSPGSIHQVNLPLEPGFPYQGTRVWVVSVESESGFVPMFTAGGRDNRFLGVRVKPELMP